MQGSPIEKFANIAKSELAKIVKKYQLQQRYPEDTLLRNLLTGTTGDFFEHYKATQKLLPNNTYPSENLTRSDSALGLPATGMNGWEKSSRKQAIVRKALQALYRAVGAQFDVELPSSQILVPDNPQLAMYYIEAIEELRRFMQANALGKQTFRFFAAYCEGQQMCQNNISSEQALLSNILTTDTIETTVTSHQEINDTLQTTHDVPTEKVTPIVTEPQNAVANRIKIVLLDIDGCVYHKYPQDEQQPIKSHSQWLIENNTLLLDHIKAGIQDQDKPYNKLILAYGTNRQDFTTNCQNQHRGGSMVPALPLIVEHLSKTTEIEVLFESFLMADIYGRRGDSEQTHRTSDECFLAAGTAYKECCHAYQNGDDSVRHTAKWVFDYFKNSLIYAHIHRAACLHPQATEIVIDFYDDSDVILEKVADFFGDQLFLMPPNVTLNLIKYTGNVPVLHKSIQGSPECGKIDKNYDWSIRFFAARLQKQRGRGASDGCDIKTASALKEHHEMYYGFKDANSYVSLVINRGGQIQMALDSYNYPQDFAAIRDQEISILSPSKCTESAYISAEECPLRDLFSAQKNEAVLTSVPATVFYDSAVDKEVTKADINQQQIL